MKEINKEILRVTQSVIVHTPNYSRFGGYEGQRNIYTMNIAKVLHDAGYRKQRVGEWISVEGDVIFKCSICDAEISTSWDYENDNMFAYCPCCGANMKGGAV